MSDPENITTAGDPASPATTPARQRNRSRSPVPAQEAAAGQAASSVNPPPPGGDNIPTPGGESVPATGGQPNPAPAPVQPPVSPPPPKTNPPPPPVQPKRFVCTGETFWKNRLWKVGETTGDPGAEGACFKEV